MSGYCSRCGEIVCVCNKTRVAHYSDCATHNMPAYPNGACGCGIEVQGLEAENATLKQQVAMLRDALESAVEFLKTNEEQLDCEWGLCESYEELAAKDTCKSDVLEYIKVLAATDPAIKCINFVAIEGRKIREMK